MLAEVRRSSSRSDAAQAPRLYSLCVEPMGEREAGDSRPTWPSSMECFLLRDWLLAGGGVGHLSRPLVVCEVYGLPGGEISGKTEKQVFNWKSD